MGKREKVGRLVVGSGLNGGVRRRGRMREVGWRCRGLAAAAGGFSGGATAVEVGFGRSGGRRGGKGEGGAISPVVNGGKGKEKGDRSGRRWRGRKEVREVGGGIG
ncbi:hypothetical protein HAX54_039955 [Datura stramonium]|uniref:Uncharacterized protein n=1 Tax=Datura stramonium TaxID=4076 RepID=A0ABS8VRI7_DATST|nr:hypothetical protein [Datura stramonium]